jgi:hypothetical protein
MRFRGTYRSFGQHLGAWTFRRVAMPPLWSGCQDANLDIHRRNKPCFTVLFAYVVDVSGRAWKKGLVPQRGFEPLTHALRMRCSTN